MSTFQLKKQIDLRRAAAGDGAHVLQPGNAVHRFFQRTRDRDHHLIDGHYAVVDGYQDAREIGFRKNRHRNGEREICAQQRQRQDQEDHRLGMGANQ